MAKNWNGTRVLIIGAARQGLALARYLARHAAVVTLNDHKPEAQMQAAMQSLADLPIKWKLGGHPLDLLEDADLVCLSGGIPLELPLVVEARRRGLPLTNDSQVFMELVPCRVIGITGSAGKTTTTTLVGRIAQAGVPSNTHAWVGGNIGVPLISYIDEIQPDDVVIMELSSFQLELMVCSPQIGAILNITPNHLDRHGTMEAYTAAKKRILDFQGEGDAAVLGREDPGAWSLADEVHGRLVSFGFDRPLSGQPGTFIHEDELTLWDGVRDLPLMPAEAVELRGEHNLLNVLAACAIAYAAGFPVEAMLPAVQGFTGIPHRLQFVRSWGGADWYNDSIATAPERAMAAIHSFDEPLVLLAGGKDKKLPWDAFSTLVHKRVDHLIVFGEAADIILKAVGPAQPGTRPYTITRCKHLLPAVKSAASIVQSGDVVLLSPGGTSFDEFTDFEERGERFIQWVKDLP